MPFSTSMLARVMYMVVVLMLEWPRIRRRVSMSLVWR